MENTPKVDLHRMLELPKCAVICRSVDDVDVFFSNAKDQLMEHMRWDYDTIIRLWNVYGDITGFTLFAGGTEPGSISYCNYDWFSKEGYELIELCDLLNDTDIDESDQSINYLLGGAL